MSLGIPKERIEHYLNKLQKMHIAYVVYKFDNRSERLVEKYKNDGEYHKITEKNQNCLICKGIRCYKEDKYMNALQKLLEKGKNKNVEK